MPSATRARPSPDGRIQACRRCHLKKRKCDRAFPKCSACLLAQVDCVIDLKPADQYLQGELERVTKLNEELQERIDRLESASSPLTQPHNPPALSHVPISPTRTLPLTLHNPTLVTLISAILAFRRSGDSPPSAPVFQAFPLANLATDTVFAEPDEDDPDLNTVQPLFQPDTLPPFSLTTTIIKRFTSDLKLAHHVTDLAQLERDARVIYTEDGLDNPTLAGSRYRIFIVLFLSGRPFLGYHEFDQDTLLQYRSRALAELPSVLARENLLCVQSLTMLSLVAIYEPDGSSLWQILGIACRTAIAIGLHRKDQPFSTPRLTTLRRSVFWTLYNLDRLLAILLGYPSALRDEDIDVEMPETPTPGAIDMTAEFCHGIRGRRLQASIHNSLYAASAQAESEAEYTTFVFDRVKEIDFWYTSSPLKTTFVPWSDSTIKRQFLDDIHYQQMIIALHRPSKRQPHISSQLLSVLLKSASIAITLFDHYITEEKVSLNWVQLHNIFDICVSLVFCYCEHLVRPDLSPVDTRTVQDHVEKCSRLLSRFHKWPQCSRFQAVFDILLQSLNPATLVTDSWNFDDLFPNVWGLSENMNA